MVDNIVQLEVFVIIKIKLIFSDTLWLMPSTMHKFMKYLWDGKEFRIPSNLQPFSMKQTRIYEDAKYFIPKEPKIA